MITWYVPLPGPFVWHPGRRVRRGHRSFRRSIAYWLFGLWAVEIVFWLTVGTILGAWLVLRLVGPHLLMAVRWIGFGLLVGIRAMFRH